MREKQDQSKPLVAKNADVSGSAETWNLAFLSSNHFTVFESLCTIMKYSRDSPSYSPIVACKCTWKVRIICQLGSERKTKSDDSRDISIPDDSLKRKHSEKDSSLWPEIGCTCSKPIWISRHAERVQLGAYPCCRKYAFAVHDDEESNCMHLLVRALDGRLKHTCNLRSCFSTASLAELSLLYLRVQSCSSR